MGLLQRGVDWLRGELDDTIFSLEFAQGASDVGGIRVKLTGKLEGAGRPAG